MPQHSDELKGGKGLGHPVHARFHTRARREVASGGRRSDDRPSRLQPVQTEVIITVGGHTPVPPALYGGHTAVPPALLNRFQIGIFSENIFLVLEMKNIKTRFFLVRVGPLRDHRGAAGRGLRFCCFLRRPGAFSPRSLCQCGGGWDRRVTTDGLVASD